MAASERPEMQVPVTQGLFSDDPIEQDSDDTLDRRRYAQHVSDVIRIVRAHGSASNVLAVVGAWGSGKSSTLSMVRRRLVESDDEWIIADFTPWLYPDVDTMQIAFFRDLRSALPKEGQWKNTGEKIEKLGAAISPFGKLTSLVGLDSSEMAKAASKILSGDTSTLATKAKAETALSEHGRPILIVIDDLDRLSPDELLMVFKLVRFVGRLPNVYYLLSYDERTILDVIMRTDLAAGDSRRAQEYMEKMVQVRLDLPALRETQATNLLNEALDSILVRNNLTLDEDQGGRLASVYDDVMTGRLNTPRSIRRFFAQVDAFYPTLSQEVDFVDFVCLTWLRTFEPQAYQFVHQNKTLLTRTSVDSENARKYWIDLIVGAKVSDEHARPVLDMLSFLFVPVRSSLSRTSSSAEYQRVHAKKGVGHPDYFDRYFAFAIPSEDIADSIVKQAFSPAESHHAEALDVLETSFMNDTARVCRKVRAFIDRGSVDPKFVLQFCCTHIEQLPQGGEIFENPRRSVEFLVREALRRVPEGEGEQVLRALATSPSSILLLAWQVERLTRPSDSIGEPARGFTWPDVAIRTVTAKIQEVLEAGKWDTIDDVPQEIFRLMHPWRTLAHGECQAFIESKVQTWGMLPILMRLVPESTIYGRETTIHKLNAFPIDEISAFVNLERALGELALEISDLPTDSNVSGQGSIDPTDANRRALVLETLRSEAERAEARRRARETGSDSDS